MRLVLMFLQASSITSMTVVGATSSPFSQTSYISQKLPRVPGMAASSPVTMLLKSKLFFSSSFLLDTILVRPASKLFQRRVVPTATGCFSNQCHPYCIEPILPSRTLRSRRHYGNLPRIQEQLSHEQNRVDPHHKDPVSNFWPANHKQKKIAASSKSKRNQLTQSGVVQSILPSHAKAIMAATGPKRQLLILCKIYRLRTVALILLGSHNKTPSFTQRRPSSASTRRRAGINI